MSDTSETDKSVLLELAIGALEAYANDLRDIGYAGNSEADDSADFLDRLSRELRVAFDIEEERDEDE